MKNKKMLYTVLSASLLLAACGSDTAEEENDQAPVEDTNQNEDTGTDETEGTETDEESGDDATTDESAEDEATDAESDENAETETDSTDAEESTEDEDASTTLEGAEETESDEQDYKMQVLADYELTSEEPGRDVLLVKDNTETFMQIETMQAADVNYETVVENMTTILAASSDDSSPVELTEEAQLPKDTAIENVTAFQVVSAVGPVTGLLFQRDDMLVKVTMHDDNDESYYEDFLKMAETIQSTNN